MKMMVPLFTASLVSSKDPSENEMPKELAIQNQKSPKKLEICFGKPVLSRQTQPNVDRSRSVSVIRFESSYMRCLRCIASKSFDTKHSTPRSGSLSCVLEAKRSKSRHNLSSASAFTYTVAGSKSVSSTTLSKSRISNSVYSDSLSRSSSYDSSSSGSKSPRSRSPVSLKHFCSKSRINHSRSPVSLKTSRSRSEIYHSKSPVPKQTRKSPSKIPVSIRSCLKPTVTKSRHSTSPVFNTSCLRAGASIIQYSRSPPPRPSCLKQPTSKYLRLRSPVPRKSCLRSSPLNLPDTKSLLSKPPCLKPSSFSYSKQSAYRPSCLRRPVVTFSKPKLSNSKSQRPRLSRLDTSLPKSPRINSNLRHDAKSPSSHSNKSPQRKSPCPKSITFKTTIKSRSPITTYSPIKSRSPTSTSPTASSKEPSYKTADARSVQSSSPQHYSPRSKSPCERFFNSINRRFNSPLPRATLPTLDTPRCPFPKSPSRDPKSPSRDPKLNKSNGANSKPEAKRCPKLTVSKIHVKSRLFQGLRRPPLRSHDGRQKPSRSLLGFYDYKRMDQERLRRHLKNNLNREYLEKSLATKMDVRYITELKNYFDRIRGTMTCGILECPAMQERLRKHRIAHHGGLPNIQAKRCENHQNCPELMMRLHSHNSVHHGGKVTGSEAQTKITLANLGDLTITLETRPTSTTNFIEGMNNAPYEPIQSNESFKRDIMTKLRQWIAKIPTREFTPEDEQRKRSTVDNFVNIINNMDLTKRDYETEQRLRKEIDIFLDYINMWYPGSNSDRAAFKDGLRENLIEKLFGQNDFSLAQSPENMGYNSPQNYLHNGPQNYANNGTQPYGTQNYGNNGTQNYMYNRSQPFGTNGPQHYGQDGMQRYANNRAPSNSQTNSIQPYGNVYTGDKGSYSGRQSYENNGPQTPQNYGNGRMQPYANNGVPPNLQPNPTQYYTNTTNNLTNPYENNRPQNSGHKLNIDLNTISANRRPPNISIDKFGNLISYGQFGTPSYAFNRNNLPNSVPNGIKTHSNNSYTLNPTQSRTLNTNQNNAINRNDNPSMLSNISRDLSKNQNQEVPKPSIKLSDNPVYENSAYTSDTVGQPRRSSLKSASNSNTNYENTKALDKEPSRVVFGPPTDRNNGINKNLSNPTTGLHPQRIDLKSLEYQNLTNNPSSIVSKQLDRCEKCPDRYLFSSKINYDVDESCEYIDTCKNKVKNKLTPAKCHIKPISYSEPNVRCTIKSNKICVCPKPDESVKLQKVCCGLKTDDLETEIADWLQKCTFICNDGLINKQEIIDDLILEITPYLSQPSYSLNKAVLKAKIINVLRGLGMSTKTNSAMRNILFKLANELANRLIGIVSRLECSGPLSWKCSVRKNRPFRLIEQVHVGPNDVNKEDLKHDLLQEFEYCVHGTKLENNKEVLETVAEIVISNIELIRRNAHELVGIDIKKILDSTNVLDEEEISNIVNNILKCSREIAIMIASTNDRTNTIITARPCISILSVYTSEHEVTPDFAAAAGSSTPKKKKEVSKLSPEENAYTNEIASAVRDWLKTAPEYFENLEDNNMKEVMILDLAGSIVDHAKLGQLITNQKMDTQQFLTYYICKWLLKFEIIDDLSRAEPYVQALVVKLREIEVPKLTRPQYGTRQVLKNIKYQETEEAWTDSFVPKAQDILEDEISIWMNEYPSEIYVNKDKSTQNKLVHEFAVNLQKHNKDDDKNVSNEIKTWLEKVVKSEDKKMIDMMSKSLKDRIVKLPQDETIVAKMKQRADNKKMAQEVSAMESYQTVEQEESDKTMKEFIIKYVEHNFDDDDPLAKRAYAKLLRHELQRLDPVVLKQVYEGQPLEKFSPQKLYRELGYVKDISDWLKTLPIDENYNKIGNPERVEFCIYLAREISDVDEDRHKEEMNYDQYIASIVCQFIGQLPLKLESTDITEYVHSLLIKIFRRRTEVPPISPDQLWANIADFLDDYIKLNGQDIANDEVKLEAWATRLLQEIKKMIVENPSSLPVADVKDRLAQVTKPGDETIKRFNHELDYAKEISDWLKNLPLIYLDNEEVIRDLAEKMTEYENKVDDCELVQYIEQWISKLPLDKSKHVDIPFVIQQLLNRRKKVYEAKATTSLPLDESVRQKNTENLNTVNSGAKTECRGCCPVDDPGAVIIEVIKEWCDNLPFKGTEEDIKCGKNDIIGKLYQKIIEINNNPRLARSDLLYLESLSEEVDELMENIPNNLKLEGNKDKLKFELFDKLKQARKFYKDITLGDDYVKDLEDAIEAVLPNPRQNAEVNPGFEAYKENLAEMFILENFDHGNDADKLKYEQIMKNEVNKFSPSAQQRTVIPIEEEKLNNDIKSTLFDISMPDEKAMVDNVEEIKTKCEIQNWFERLPLQPIIGEAELLERDLKVSLLARKLHIFEFEKDPDQKIHKEITKWLAKAPLLPGEDRNINAFADDLQEILKSTRKSRKCVKASDIDIGKGGILSGLPDDQNEQNSIWVNPNSISKSEKGIQQPPRLKSGDILIDIVEKWSDNIPLPPLPNDQLQIIKGDLRTRLYKKISELNSTNTFDDDQMYNQLMGQEISQAIEALPTSDALIQSQYALQHQLISAIESIKPLIREERAVHEYKTEVKNTVNSILGRLEHPTAEEELLLSKIQEEVVSDFIEYKYNKGDEEGQQFYKNKILDALTEYNFIGEIEENRNEIISDSLVEANKIICELDKIPPPDEPALKEEVEELRMKREVDNFLNNVVPIHEVPNNIRRNSLRNSLAKQLHELEKTGHSVDNDKKMEAAVNRTLKKLNAETKRDEVKPFLAKLKKNEAIRRLPGYRDSPSKALRSLMRDQFPPHDSASLDPEGVHLQVDASVYKPDYIPTNWKPPTAPPPLPVDGANLDLLVVLPRQSLPPSPGPIESRLMPPNVRHTITQPSQTPTYMSGVTQTSGLPPEVQQMGRHSPGQPSVSSGQVPPQYDPRFVPGQYPSSSQFDPRLIPGQSQFDPRLIPGPGQFDPRLIPGQGQFDPRLIPGQGQFDPRLIPGQGQFIPPQAPNSRMESELDLLNDACLCEFCNNRCPYFNCDSCDDFFPMNPMLFRRPMMPVPPMMGMPCPQMIPPPAFMYC